MQENMVRAQKRDAIRRERFYFRKSVVPDDDEDETNEGVESRGSHDHEYTEMSVDTILNGKASDPLVLVPFHSIPLSWNQDEFPGLIPLVRMYVNSIDIDVDTRCTVMQYLRLIAKRASGKTHIQTLKCCTLYIILGECLAFLASGSDPTIIL